MGTARPEPPTVDAAMRATPRRDFLPRAVWHRAHFDFPLSIGHEQTNSQPSTVRSMLELLKVRSGQRVLDVGSGSGWTTAILARLVGPTGTVIGVELEPALAKWGRANVTAAGVPWARVETAEPAVLGWPTYAPYDRILVSAMAEEVPKDLVGQLDLGGIMVVPVAGRMLRLQVTPDGGEDIELFGHYRFVPLRLTSSPLEL